MNYFKRVAMQETNPLFMANQNLNLAEVKDYVAYLETLDNLTAEQEADKKEMKAMLKGSCRLNCRITSNKLMGLSLLAMVGSFGYIYSQQDH